MLHQEIPTLLLVIMLSCKLVSQTYHNIILNTLKQIVFITNKKRKYKWAIYLENNSDLNQNVSNMWWLLAKHFNPAAEAWIFRDIYVKAFAFDGLSPLHHHEIISTLIARFMGPTWGPHGSCRPQMGPMLAPWTLLSGQLWHCPCRITRPCLPRWRIQISAPSQCWEMTENENTWYIS